MGNLCTKILSQYCLGIIHQHYNIRIFVALKRLVCKFGLTLALHHAFGVDVLGVLLATVVEFIINILKRRIMKTVKFKNLMDAFIKSNKLIDIKKSWVGLGWGVR